MIGTGAIAAGDRLPSIRQLAPKVGVNVNTVRAVYRRLEAEGLITSQQGLGTFATERAAWSPEVKRLAADSIAAAREAEIEPRDLAIALYAGAGTLEPGLPDDASRSTSTLPDLEQDSDQVIARRELRRQIARLEAELAAYAKELGLEKPPHPLLRPIPHVADVAELEEIRNKLVERLRAVQAKVARQGKRQQRARARREDMAREPDRHRWEWVSNEEAGEPACGTWHVRPTYGPLGALLGWWRVKVSSGCPLAAPLEAAPRQRSEPIEAGHD